MAGLSLQAGTILVENGTFLPTAIQSQPGTFSVSWGALSSRDSAGLKSGLADAGWTLFYMAGALHKHAFGFDGTARVRTAIARMIRDVQAQKCNCLEITHLATKTFLGVPYASITAHARHIQHGCQFHGG